MEQLLEKPAVAVATIALPPKAAEIAQVQKNGVAVSSGSGETVESLEAEEEETFFQDIYLLTEHGISIQEVELLRKYGIKTIKGLRMTIRSKLLEIKGFTGVKVDKIREVCGRITEGFKTALQVAEEHRAIFKILTGSANLDNILEGGVESMSITEFFGESRTGKTQIAHTLCVTAQMPREDGYPGGKVMYIDTENTFRPQRIRQIARRFELMDRDVLENILYARAYNSEHQYELLKSVSAKFHEEAGIFKLLVIDSVMAQFKVDFCGNAQLRQRQQKLNKMLSRLQKISEEFNVAVFITNHVVGDFKTPMSLADADVPKPTGGNAMAHASTTRVALKNAEVYGKNRVAFIFDSPKLEQREATFTITVGGINDPPEEIILDIEA